MEHGFWTVDPGDGYYGVMWWRTSDMGFIKGVATIANLMLGNGIKLYSIEDLTYVVKYLLGCYDPVDLSTIIEHPSGTTIARSHYYKKFISI